MNALDYLDWSRMAGLYLRNVSHVDRYRTYQPLLSPAGLTTVIVGEFLENTDPVVDVVTWRTHSVYEMGAEQAERISRTADALEAIGAARIAGAVRTAQSNSPFDKIQEMFAQGNLKDFSDLKNLMQGTKGIDLLNHLRENIVRAMPDMAEEAGILPAVSKSPPPVSPDHESREQIEHLLAQFVAKHRSELQHDLNRHGDPRQAPGYTREGRLQEIDDLRRQTYAAERQREQVAKFQELTAAIRKLTGNPGEVSKRNQSKLEKLRVEFRNLYKENRAAAAVGPLIPEMAAAMKSADTFMASLPDVFAPQKLGDDKLTARAQALGEFETTRSSGNFEVEWDHPKGFKSDWAGLSLQISYPKSKPEALEKLLDAVDRMRQRLPELLREWQEELISTFRNVYWAQMHWEMDEYEVDDEGNATDESILSHVDGGRILLDIDPDEGYVFGTIFFHVDWDDEHGFEIHWNDEPVEEQGSEDAAFDVTALGLTDAGPKLTSADIVRFESTFGLELPEEYRQFLLAANGGVPQRTSFSAVIQSEKIPADVIWFFSLQKSSAEPYPAGSLEAAAQKARVDNWPPNLLPIGEAQIGGAWSGMAGMPENDLVLVLSGKKKGRILVATLSGMLDMFPGMTDRMVGPMVASMMAQLTETAPVAGRNLREFLDKLQKPATDDIPEWLKAIRADDVLAFGRWMKSGGKANEIYQDRGAPFPMQVLDYLASSASAGILRSAAYQKLYKPAQLRDSWMRYCRQDIGRFRVLMQVLPKDMWKSALASYSVWDQLDLLEELAESGVDFNQPADEEGQTPISLAVQFGKTEAVKWLLQHGADPNKYDKYQRNAFTWTDRGPGYDCLAILQGNENVAPPRAAQADVPAIDQLLQAAKQLPADTSLMLVIQIKSPPVTQVEKRWNSECHYRLSYDIHRHIVTLNDMTSARQEYMHTDGYPAVLFLPILQWPELTPLWDTVEVQECDWAKAIKKPKYKPTPRPDLIDAARQALEQGFNAEEAAARSIRLRK